MNRRYPQPKVLVQAIVMKKDAVPALWVTAAAMVALCSLIML